MAEIKGVERNQLKNHIARAVMVAPDINPKTGQQYTDEAAFTFRPGWSGQGPYEVALPGGKIELSEEKNDFKEILTPEEQADPFLVLTLEQMIQAGLNAAEREVLEELDVVLVPGVLRLVDVSTNDAGYTTYAYLADLPEKPELRVKTNSAGSFWMDIRRIFNDEPQMLSGHLEITRKALKART